VAELHAVARFFVNHSGERANRRRLAWLGEHLKLPAKSRCLEIGCGNGAMALGLVARFRPGSYRATDLDPRQIEVARERIARHAITGAPTELLLETADMTHLPMPTGSVDAVFAFSAIHHASPNHREFARVPLALAEIERVLAPGGILAFEEFVHKAAIRSWLEGRGFVLEAHARRWTRELFIFRKPG